MDEFNELLIATTHLLNLEHTLDPSAPADHKAIACRFKEQLVKKGLDKDGGMSATFDLVRKFCEEENLDLEKLEKLGRSEDDKEIKEENRRTWSKHYTTVEKALEVPNFEEWLQEAKEGDHVESKVFMAKNTHYMLRLVPHLPGGKMAITVSNLCSNDTVLDHVILAVGEEEEHMYNMENSTTTYKSHADCKALMKNGSLRFTVEVVTFADKEKDEDKDEDKVSLTEPACGLASCSNKGTLKCSRCLGMLYCSKACGKANWNHHKKDCKKAENNK